uniref:Uncharacterized protein n=1 Tax=Mustela putorius furo TaxID=9669 RepID=M3YW87_MUSPF
MVRESLSLSSPQYLPLAPGFQILGRTSPAHVTRPPDEPGLRGPPRLATIPRSAPGGYRANRGSNSGSEPARPNCAGWRKGGGRGLELCGPHCSDPGPSHPLLPPPGLHLLRASQNALLVNPPNGAPGTHWDRDTLAGPENPTDHARPLQKRTLAGVDFEG